MRIRKHPNLDLWLRDDGAICIPPSGKKYKKFRWTYGSKNKYGYRTVCINRKNYMVARLICEAFHRL